MSQLFEFPSHEAPEIPVDLYESDTHFIAVFETPGLAKGDIQVNIDDGQLRVSYELPADSEEKAEERSRGLDLPRGIDEAGIVAKSKDGHLTISIPKKDDQREISIS